MNKGLDLIRDTDIYKEKISQYYAGELNYLNYDKDSTFSREEVANFNRFLAMRMFFEENYSRYERCKFYGVHINCFEHKGEIMYEVGEFSKKPLSEKDFFDKFMSYLETVNSNILNLSDNELFEELHQIESDIESFIEVELDDVDFNTDILSPKNTLQTHFVASFKEGDKERKFLVVPSFLNVKSFFDEEIKKTNHLNVSCLVFELENDNFKYIQNKDGSNIVVSAINFEELETFLRAQQADSNEKIELKENSESLEMLFRAMSKNSGNTSEEFVPIIFLNNETTTEKNITISLDKDKIILDSGNNVFVKYDNILEFIMESYNPESSISKILKHNQYGIPANLDKNYQQIREYTSNLISQEIQKNINESSLFLLKSETFQVFKNFENEYVSSLEQDFPSTYILETKWFSKEDNQRYENFLNLYNFLQDINIEKDNSNLISRFNKIVKMSFDAEKTLTPEQKEQLKEDFILDVKEFYEELERCLNLKAESDFGDKSFEYSFTFEESKFKNSEWHRISDIRKTLNSEEVDDSLISTFLNDFYKQATIQKLLYNLNSLEDCDVKFEKVKDMTFEQASMFLFEEVYSKKDLGLETGAPYLKVNPNSNGKVDLEKTVEEFVPKMLSFTEMPESFIDSKDFKIDCLNKNIVTTNKELIQNIEENFDKNRKDNHQESYMIREYIKSGIEFPGASMKLKGIQGEYNSFKRNFGEEYSNKWIDSYLQSMDASELEQIYFDNKKNLNDFYQVISTSFDDILEFKINSLDNDKDCFSIKCDGFWFDIKYLREDTFEFTISNIKNGAVQTQVVGEPLWDKKMLMEFLTDEEVLKDKEKEQFRQENLKEYLENNLSTVYSSRFGTEGINDILDKDIPLEEKLLRSLYSDKTFIMTNSGYDDKRKMIIFDKVGDDIYMKSFTPSNIITSMEDINDISLNKGNCTHIRKGVDSYKLPGDNGYLQVETKKIGVEDVKTILSTLQESQWHSNVSNTLTIQPPSTKDYFTERSREDNACLNFYIQKRSLSEDNKITSFLSEKVHRNLESEARNSGIKRTSYVYDVKGNDGSINKFIINLSQNSLGGFDMEASIVYRNPNGEVTFIDDQFVKNALVYREGTSILDINDRTSHNGFMKMVFESMLENQDQLKNLGKLLENSYFTDYISSNPNMSNIEVFQNIMNEYKDSYQKYIYCMPEFDFFMEKLKESKDFTSLNFNEKDFYRIDLILERETQRGVKERIKEMQKQEDESGSKKQIILSNEESKILNEEVKISKIKELQYFIKMHNIITSDVSNDKTMERLLLLENENHFVINKVYKNDEIEHVDTIEIESA